MSEDPKKTKYSAAQLASAVSNHPDFLIGRSKKARKKLLKRVIKQLRSRYE
jgi:hypothetical protein